MLRRIVGVPLPSDEVYESAEELLGRLKYVHDLLSDPDRSSVRLVLNLERVSIQEAQRSFTYFHLYGYPTDLIVANRVLPAASGAYFDAWREAQARYLPMVERAVRAGAGPDDSVLRQGDGRHRSTGGAGPCAVRRLGPDASSSTAAVPTRSSARTVATRWSVELPVHLTEEVSLSRAGDELILQVGALAP